MVALTVTPPNGQPLPPDNTPVIDVEGYIEGELVNGIELRTFIMHKYYIFLPITLR